jgi:hypothetical protein
MMALSTEQIKNDVANRYDDDRHGDVHHQVMAQGFH